MMRWAPRPSLSSSCGRVLERAGADDDRVGARCCGYLDAGRGHDGTGRITLRDASHGFPHHRQRHRRPSRGRRSRRRRRRDAAHEGRPDGEQHRVRAGRHRRGRRPRRSPRSALRRHHGRRRRTVRGRRGPRAGRRGPPLRRASWWTGARSSTATRTERSRSPAKRRTRCAACCTPPTRPAASWGAPCGSRPAPSSRLEVLNHTQAIQLIVEDGVCVGARFMADAGVVADRG